MNRSVHCFFFFLNLLVLFSNTQNYLETIKIIRKIDKIDYVLHQNYFLKKN